MVKIKYYGLFREIAGLKEEEIMDNIMSLEELLNLIVRKYPKMRDAISRGDFIIIVNEKTIPDKKIPDVRIKQGDTVELLPVVSGG